METSYCASKSKILSYWDIFRSANDIWNFPTHAFWSEIECLHFDTVVWRIDIDPLIGHEEEYDLAEALQNNQDCLSEGLTCDSVSDEEESDYEEEEGEGQETEEEEGEEFSNPRNIFEVLDDEEDL